MNQEIKDLGLQIIEILKEEYNPHVRVEIDSEGIKMTSTDCYEPAEVNTNN